MSKTAADNLDNVFRGLADSTRRLILDELRRRDEQSLFEICVRLVESHNLSLSRQAVSKHIAVLESAGLVRTTWSGRTKLHSLDSAPIRHMGRGWLAKYLSSREHWK